MENLRQILDSYLELVPLNNSVTQFQAAERAAQFLLACSKMADFVGSIDKDHTQAISLEKAVYAEVLSTIEGDKITEKKIMIEADPRYLKVREKMENLNGDLSYLKTYYDIFHNAHILYRAVSKTLE